MRSSRVISLSLLCATFGAGLSACTDVLDSLCDPEFDVWAAVDNLIVMERSLSESLFVHFKLFVDEEHRATLTRLAENSASHADRLAELMD